MNRNIQEINIKSNILKNISKRKFELLSAEKGGQQASKVLLSSLHSQDFDTMLDIGQETNLK